MHTGARIKRGSPVDRVSLDLIESSLIAVGLPVKSVIKTARRLVVVLEEDLPFVNDGVPETSTMNYRLNIDSDGVHFRWHHLPPPFYYRIERDHPEFAAKTEEKGAAVWSSLVARLAETEDALVATGDRG